MNFLCLEDKSSDKWKTGSSRCARTNYFSLVIESLIKLRIFYLPSSVVTKCNMQILVSSCSTFSLWKIVLNRRKNFTVSGIYTYTQYFFMKFSLKLRKEISSFILLLFLPRVISIKIIVTIKFCVIFFPMPDYLAVRLLGNGMKK